MDGDYAERMEMIGEDPDEEPEEEEVPEDAGREADEDIVPDSDPDVEVVRTKGQYVDNGVTVLFREVDSKGRLVADPREMHDHLTDFERARIIGARAQQLANGGTPLVDCTGLTDAMDIARKELIERKIPFLIRRKHTETLHEAWNVNELVQNERKMMHDRALEISPAASSAPKTIKG